MHKSTENKEPTRRKVEAPLRPPEVPIPGGLLAVDDVAKLLSCSSRHVYRLSDSGRMPAPVKLGKLCRWPSEGLKIWIATGCPKCRPTGSLGRAFTEN